MILYFVKTVYFYSDTFFESCDCKVLSKNNIYNDKKLFLLKVLSLK